MTSAVVITIKLDKMTAVSGGEAKLNASVRLDGQCEPRHLLIASYALLATLDNAFRTSMATPPSSVTAALQATQMAAGVNAEAIFPVGRRAGARV